MYLTLDEAKQFVRARMDELSTQLSEFMADASVTTDDANLDEIISKHIIEAIKAIHLVAPSPLMEGTTMTSTDATWSVGTDQVGSLVFSKAILRLVTLRIAGILVEPIAENSTIARLQANKYMRGTTNDPVLVQLHNTADHKPKFKLYTCPSSQSMPDAIIYPVPELTTNGYFISAQLKDAVLNHLTGMVLDSYSNNQMAQVFYAKAEAYLK